MPLSAESNDGMMLRGGFQAAKAYVAYVSGISTGHNNLQSTRDVGGRVAFFLSAGLMLWANGRSSCKRLFVRLVPSKFPGHSKNSGRYTRGTGQRQIFTPTL